MEKKLIDCRDRIDNLDKELMELFEKRMSIVLEVAKYKKGNNIPIFNKKREDEVIEKNLKRLENDKLKPYAEEMLHCLMDVSKKYQLENLNGE